MLIGAVPPVIIVAADPSKDGQMAGVVITELVNAGAVEGKTGKFP